MLQSLGGSLVQQRASCVPAAVSTRPPFQHRSPSAAGRLCSGFAPGGCAIVQQHAQQRIGRDACIARAGKGFGTKKEAAGSSTVPTGSCPCGSGRSYQTCCGKYHDGTASPESPESLLRSRFTAYKMGLIDFLVATTHPENPEYSGGARSYGRSVKATARANDFLELKIGEQKPGASEEEAMISFEIKYRSKAPSEQGKAPATAQETSRFVRTGGKWLFRDSDREAVVKDVGMAKPTLQY